jgi:hypothetical protein
MEEIIVSRSLKMELIKDFEEGKMNEKDFGTDGVDYTGMVICKVLYVDGKDKVFGYEPHAEHGKVFFLSTVYPNKVKSPWFRRGTKRYLLENFIVLGAIS